MYSTNPTLTIDAHRADMLREARKQRLIQQAQPATQRRHPSFENGLRILLALLLVRPH